MALQKGDFILINYTAKVKETNEVFDTTVEETAKQEHIKKLAEKGINPSLGMRIEFGGKNAVIRSIGAGRALLDFNPPLAGKTLIYDVLVQKKLETPEEKIGAIIHRRIPVV